MCLPGEDAVGCSPCFGYHHRPFPSCIFVSDTPGPFGDSSILVYLKTSALQIVHGRLFGMVQGKANQWIHVLLPALLAALRALGDAPTRSLTALAQRLDVSEADAATVVAPLEEERAPLAAAARPRGCRRETRQFSCVHLHLWHIPGHRAG